MDSADVRQLIESYLDKTGGIIQACHAVMRTFGFISAEHRDLLAEIFNISRAEVRGIISFYHDFRTTPQPARKVRICQAEACQALGARQLTQEVSRVLGVPLGHPNETQPIALEAVYCLGLCAIGPAAEVNTRLIARASVASIEAAL